MVDFRGGRGGGASSTTTIMYSRMAATAWEVLQIFRRDTSSVDGLLTYLVFTFRAILRQVGTSSVYHIIIVSYSGRLIHVQCYLGSMREP